MEATETTCDQLRQATIALGQLPNQEERKVVQA